MMLTTIKILCHPLALEETAVAVAVRECRDVVRALALQVRLFSSCVFSSFLLLLHPLHHLLAEVVRYHQLHQVTFSRLEENRQRDLR